MSKLFWLIGILFCSFMSCSLKDKTVAKEPVMEKIEKNDSNFSSDYITGRYEPGLHKDFIKIDSAYTDKKEIYLRKEAYHSFKRMAEASKRDGVYLIIKSATRNFEYQKGIWERKWTGETLLEVNTNASIEYSNPFDRARAILKYSSMPGTSRHHWGTDIDLNEFENEYFNSGQGLKIYTWLVQNAPTFGFCQVYTQKGVGRPTGYEEEKWHWTYMPISVELTTWAKDHLEALDIKGFLGAETAKSLNVIEHYVLGINHECLNQTVID